MKAFLEKLFKSKKQKQKELLDEIIDMQSKEHDTKVEKQATKAIVESMAKEVKKEKHVDCECNECINRIKQNAK